MARLLRIQYEGAIYHVTVRGNARQNLFRDDRDRERFLRQLADSVDSYEVRLYLFCLMTNHFHLLVETPRGNLSAFMGRLLTSYTVYFNRRHQTCGHVTQGRYGAKPVEGDEYLLKLSRYVHLNPVFTEAARDLPLKQRLRLLREYRWSSYPSYIGQRKQLAFVDDQPLLELVGRGRWRGTVAYRTYVESGLVETDEEFQAVLKESTFGIGSEKFCKWMQYLYSGMVGKAHRREDAALRRPRKRIGADRILEVVGSVMGVEPDVFMRRRRDAIDRAVAARMLCRYGGLTHREAGELLGVGSGAAVSHQLKALADRMGTVLRLHRQVTQIEGILEKESAENVKY